MVKNKEHPLQDVIDSLRLSHSLLIVHKENIDIQCNICVTYCLNRYDDEGVVTPDIREILLLIESVVNDEDKELLSHMYDEIRIRS